MQTNKYKQWMCVFFFAFLGQLLTACEPQYVPKLDTVAVKDSLEEAVSLTQATHTVTSAPISQHVKHVLSPAEEFWVGQYSAVLTCSDPFCDCDEGQLTYVLNFASDGYVYRNMVMAGKISVDEPKRKRHLPRKDRWSLSFDQQYLVVHLKEGVDIFWKIKDNQRIQIDMDAIRKYNLTEQFKAFFQERRFPENDVILERRHPDLVKSDSIKKSN